MSAGDLTIGDRVKIFLESRYWRSTGWFEGTLVRIDPYSAHRSFHWVELDVDVQSLAGGNTRLVSVLNPARIERMQDGLSSSTP